MKRLTMLVLAVALLIPAFSYAEYVGGYTRKDGTYVEGYNRSDRNNTVTDNFDYKGNTNPYTGETGSNYYRNDPSSEYYRTSSNRSSNRYGSAWGGNND